MLMPYSKYRDSRCDERAFYLRVGSAAGVNAVDLSGIISREMEETRRLAAGEGREKC